MRFANKTAIVTGAGQGIGRATAELLLHEGAHVVAIEWDAGLAADLAAFAPGRVDVVTGDAADRRVIETCVERALAVRGAIDVLVNNAASYDAGSLHESDDASWERTISSVLGGVARMTRACLPHFLERGGGAIVNVASVNQIVANPGLAAYTAAKGGVSALTRQLAVEYGGRGLRVNAVSPGFIVTPRTAQHLSAQARALAEEAYPVGRLGEARDVANAIAFLASAEAAFVNGVDLPVDGGLTVTAASAIVSPHIREWWGRKPLQYKEGNE